MTDIRDALSSDLDAILAIHNEAILNSRAIWLDEPVHVEDREAWLAERQKAGHPVVVAVVDGSVIAYASYGPWQSRSGYRFTVENSVYVAAGHRGRGIGALLLAELLERAQRAGMHVMVADIEAGNSASIKLHERFGFTTTGTLHQVGTKFGEWLDLVFMERKLDDAPVLTRIAS
ncbi:GNAT family N-acetyltransferase [Mycetocola zhujimingii]|uniref:GNAT family N-acetyltransferase n=1 Tax=Mycetocola zhujimingii TaxID=2079792 RepID=UPI000D386DE0|nr:GNAT family N-acetyltransferase [Mycetocola zhujimingii]AWB86161.1 GNAT family N-acetyltransferase [Mycetocola zhujimingii]